MAGNPWLTNLIESLILAAVVVVIVLVGQLAGPVVCGPPLAMFVTSFGSRMFWCRKKTGQPSDL